MEGLNNGIVYYHYSFSPFGRRVLWYLALRGIDYAQVVQPVIMPRPDLEAIGVKYRRIPVMTIGKDVYCDTRLILSKLEQLFPGNTLGASKSDEKAIEQLLQIWSVEAGLFVRASQLIPSSMPLLNDPKFVKDREQFSGRSWDKNQIDANRPEALSYILNGFRILETTLLADGREWILRTDEPTMADIEGKRNAHEAHISVLTYQPAVWTFDWLNGMKGALPRDVISEKQFPKVFAWITRFNKAIKLATEKAPKPPKLKGTDAAQRVLKSDFAEKEGSVDPSDPTGLKKGTAVQVWPVDSGFSHRDQGHLVALNGDEIVIRIENGLRLHFPRTGFRIRPTDAGNAAKL